MKNKTKGEILVYVSIALLFFLITVKGNRILTFVLPTDVWILVILVGFALGYIMSNSDS